MSLVTDLIGGFSGIELIWTGLALLGIFVSAENATEAWRDMQALGGIRNGRRILARGAIRREAIRMLVYVLYLVIGIASGLSPADPDAQLSVVAIILVVTSLSLTVNSIFDRRDRRGLRCRPPLGLG